MNKEKIIILTNSFPYTPEDTFLTAEIFYLSQKFRQIDIIASNWAVKHIKFWKKEKFEVPTNIKIRTDIFKKIYFFSFLKYFGLLMVPVILQKKFRKDLILEIKNNYKYGLLAILRIVQKIQEAFLVYSILERSYQNEKNIFYCYWLNSSAMAVSYLDPEKNMRFSRVHGYDLYAERYSPAYIPFQGCMLKKLDYVVPISLHGRGYILKKYPDYQEKIVLHRLGVKDGKNLSFSSPDETLRIVTCSSISKVKRLDLFARAFIRLGMPVYWRHFGDGPQEKQVTEILMGLPENLEYDFSGHVPNNHIHEYYQNNPVDLFINVSAFEGLPVSIMEALSYGISVLATDAGGTGEMVNDKNGYLIPKQSSPQDIVKKIEEFYCLSREEKLEKKQYAYSTWKQYVNCDKQYPLFVDWIEQKAREKLLLS